MISVSRGNNIGKIIVENDGIYQYTSNDTVKMLMYNKETIAGAYNKYIAPTLSSRKEEVSSDTKIVEPELANIPCKCEYCGGSKFVTSKFFELNEVCCKICGYTLTPSNWYIDNTKINNKLVRIIPTKYKR